ncbi:5-formyltetrahydrofolate cyclo-ligase [Neobacillus jeddahensis]|uniref:5-formyltetrahydrofolate cyclo-ligase n=1 Tax=Neobacillus jeddahensis TaxID=1461580 RepID=UPI0005901FF3|nr:5-formyltetrahydrofolate cyclo-ligase [Neobacillus jeddahensis]
MFDKQSVRKQVQEELAKLNKPRYEDYSYKIANRLYKDEDWIQANVIAITVSRMPEVDTYQIIRKAWEQGKQVVVPKCLPKGKQLVFRTIKSFSQLESVYYGLFEPIEQITTKVEVDRIDLIIVPGLAYTSDGYRIGFGGGYYDRLLSHFSGNTLSLAFNEQIIPHFPIEDHDIPVLKIITTDRTITIK